MVFARVHLNWVLVGYMRMKEAIKTVELYLDSLPADRRLLIASLRAAIVKNLDKDFAEGIQHGMIAYYVPHRIYPTGYHCDPKKPLPLAFLASQKNHVALHLMPAYAGFDGPGAPYATWLREACIDAGKKLDMGAACIKFKKLDDVPMSVIGKAIRRVSVKGWIEICESAVNAKQKKKVPRKQVQ